MATIKNKGDVIITKFTIEESMSMINSQPYLKDTDNIVMKKFGLTQEEFDKIQKENMEWALS